MSQDLLEAPWRSLVTSVCGEAGPLSGVEVADRVNASPSPRQVAGVLNASLIRVLTADGGQAEEGVEARAASDLVNRLRPEILIDVLQVEPDVRRRRELIQGAVERLSVTALVRMTSAIAFSMEQPFSSALRAQVRRLAGAATGSEPAAAEYADRRLRALMREVASGWMQPQTREKGGFEPAVHWLQPRATGRTTPEAERVIQVALECEAPGAAVLAAVNDLVEAGETRLVIDMLSEVPGENAAADEVVKQIATPEGLAAALQQDPPDTAAADVLIRGLGLSAAKVMLETMVESRSRSTRRYLIDKLAALGPEIRPLAEGRLKDRRWFVLRNIVALFRASGSPADPSTAERLLRHDDHRVRRETLLWCLESPAMRERAITDAIADGDPAMLRPALQAARAELPASAVPILARRLLQPDFPPEFRVPAIQLLGQSGSLLAVEALLHFVQNGTNFRGRPRLAARSPEMLAALRALARRWPEERRVQPLLVAARDSRDAKVAEVVTKTAGERNA